MSKEDIQRIIDQLSKGIEPVIRLRPRAGRDMRLMRVTGTNGRNFHGVLIDSKKEDKVSLPYDTILHGTLSVEQVENP